VPGWGWQLPLRTRVAVYFLGVLAGMAGAALAGVESSTLALAVGFVVGAAALVAAEVRWRGRAPAD
jgi:hypothetical protein